MGFVSTRIKSTEFVGPLTGTATTASTAEFAQTASVSTTASFALSTKAGGDNYAIQFNSGSTLSGSVGLNFIYPANAFVQGIDQDIRIDVIPRQVGYGSVKFGNNTRTTATGAFAEGYQSVAQGTYSHAAGFQTLASGGFSTTTGYKTIASGTYANADGFETIAIGIATHTQGRFTTAQANYSHAEGYLSTASGWYAHAEGQNTIANGTASHAEGYFATANGAYSHAEGSQTLASGLAAHAEGFNTTASGQYSHAEGLNSVAIGTYSHVEGIHTVASASGQTVVGQYNRHNNTSSVFVVGAGANDGDRKDLALFNIDGVEFLKPVTASLVSGSLFGTASFAATASNAFTASYAITASHINTLKQDVAMTGSWEMIGNLTVNGTASFLYTTASQTLVNQNTITVFGSGSVLPQAGLIAADTASVYTSGSWLWDFPGQYWFTTASISASNFNGTASFASTYPTREFTFTPATASWICEHNLGTRWVQVTCWDTNTNLVILPDEIEALSTASIKISFTAPVEGVARIS